MQIKSFNLNQNVISEKVIAGSFQQTNQKGLCKQKISVNKKVAAVKRVAANKRAMFHC